MQIGHNRLVSVIVPVYNVEAYLEKCITSIVQQTYSDIEIIIVNDGSTDMSLSICKKFSEIDKRIAVYNQKNRGLSSARNVGIDKARGAFITFVDSDDSISLDMVEVLMGVIDTYRADVATCQYRAVYGTDDVQLVDVDVTASDDPLTTADFLQKAMRHQGVSFHACFKLYRTSLFENIRFPEGRLFEDAGTIYKVIAQADTIVVSPAVKYYYLQRQDSITGSKFSAQMSDLIDFSEDLLAFVKHNYPSTLQAASYYLFTNAVFLLQVMISSKSEMSFPTEKMRYKAVIKSRSKQVMSDPFASMLQRLYAILALINFNSLIVALRVKNYLVKTMAARKRS